MWYASDESTFQQYGWRDGDVRWEHQGSFEHMNGHAGVGCYSWGPGTVTYAMFVNRNNEVEFFWRDTNTNLTNTTSHPINIWVKGMSMSKDLFGMGELTFSSTCEDPECGSSHLARLYKLLLRTNGR